VIILVSKQDTRIRRIRIVLINLIQVHILKPTNDNGTAICFLSLIKIDRTNEKVIV
jgi:hypothetical protein